MCSTMLQHISFKARLKKEDVNPRAQTRGPEYILNPLKYIEVALHRGKDECGKVVRTPDAAGDNGMSVQGVREIPYV